MSNSFHAVNVTKLCACFQNKKNGNLKITLQTIDTYLKFFRDSDFWSTVTSLAGDEEKAAELRDDDDPQVIFLEHSNQPSWR